MKRYLSPLVFPLTLSFLLAMVGFWLNRTTTIDFTTVVLNPERPQYQMEEINAHRFNQQGVLENTISAKKAWQLPKNDTIFLANPQVQMMDKGELLYQIHANEAQYALDSKILKLINKVILIKTQAKKDTVKISMDNLQVNTEDKLAQTDSQIFFESGRSRASAVGLRYNGVNGQVNLISNVKATIYDIKK